MSLDDVLLRRVDPITKARTAYDGAYVAVAEAVGTQLITDDHLILEIAKAVAHPLAESRG